MNEKMEWNESVITLKNNDGKIKIKFNNEGVDELVNVFKTIMTYMTYHPKTIDSVFHDESSENYELQKDED